MINIIRGVINHVIVHVNIVFRKKILILIFKFSVSKHLQSIGNNKFVMKMFYLNIKHCRNYKIDYIINYRFWFKVGLVSI